MATTCTVTQNWEHDGMLDIHNDQTLRKYHAIRKEQYEHEHPETVWEFSDIKKVLAALKPHLKEGEKIIQFANGGFATPKGLEMMKAYWKSIDERIRQECDPQEVYYYEYNNHESPINFEGDTEAIQIILDIYGENVARSIKRFSKHMTIDQLLLEDVQVQGLWMDNEETMPEYIWFSNVDGKAYCHYQGKLWPVHSFFHEDKQYEAQDKAWWGMSCSYKNGKLTNWHKD